MGFLIDLLVFLSTSGNKKAQFSFDNLRKRPAWGSGLSVAELGILRLEHGWSKVPDVRMDGIDYVVQIRGQIFRSNSSPTMLAHLKMQMW
jgi:hypothetical protein